MTDERKGTFITLVISQIIITAFMVWDVYIFITKQSVVAKTFAVTAFVMFMLMTIMFIISIPKLKKKRV